MTTRIEAGTARVVVVLHRPRVRVLTAAAVGGGGGLDQTTADGLYVNVDGDRMHGSLWVTGADSAIYLSPDLAVTEETVEYGITATGQAALDSVDLTTMMSVGVQGELVVHGEHGARLRVPRIGDPEHGSSVQIGSFSDGSGSVMSVGDWTGVRSPLHVHGPVVLYQQPVAPEHATTKQYVDDTVTRATMWLQFPYQANTVVGQAYLIGDGPWMHSVLMGYQSTSSGSCGTALGSYASVHRDGGTALGYSSDASDDGTAVGRGAQAGRAQSVGVQRSVAVGAGATANAAYAVAVGSSAVAAHAGSVAVGADASGASAVASGPDRIALGTAAHTVEIAGALTVQGAPVVLASEVQALREEVAALRATLGGGGG